MTVASRGCSRDGNWADKSKIIDEFAASTGYHPKHVMRVLPAGPSGRRSAPRPSRRIYGAAEREALIVLWEASDRGCGKRLKAINGERSTETRTHEIRDR